MQTDDRESLPREAKPRSAFGPMLLLLVVAAGLLFVMQLRRPGFGGAGRRANSLAEFIGQPLPPLELSGWLNTDRTLSADDLRGHVVLVDFWSSDCGPCLYHMPALAKFHQRFAGRGVMVVGLTAEPPTYAARIKETADAMNMNWPIGYGAGLAFQMVGIYATPTYVLYDRAGRSVWSSHTLDGLEDAVVAELAKG